jgi:hypothetical protein
MRTDAWPASRRTFNNTGDGPDVLGLPALMRNVRIAAVCKGVGGSTRTRPTVPGRSFVTYFGMSTVSMACMTPFEAATLALTTLASLTITPMLSFLIITD